MRNERVKWVNVHLLSGGCAHAQVIRRDEVSGAATLLYKVLVDRGVSWAQACTMLADAVAAAKAASERKQARFLYSGMDTSSDQ